MTGGTRVLLALGVGWLASMPSGAHAQGAEPFRTRNLNPPAAIFGLPIWADLPDRHQLGVVTEFANHYRLSQRGADRLILDGETHRINLFFETPIAERWAFSVDVPYFRQSGGVLDDVVDAWHSTFHLPDGGRNNRPEDALLFQIENGIDAAFNLAANDQGLGDVKLALARRVGSYVVQLGLELPTGKERILAGSSSIDTSLSLMRPRKSMLGGHSAGYFWGVGVLKLGGADLIPLPTEDYSAVGVLGGGIALKPRVGIKGQIDVYTPQYETELEELGQTALQATIGGWWQMSDSGQLEFAVSEDLHVSTAPDIVIHVGLRWAW